MLSLEEYKTLLAEYLKDLTDEQVKVQYQVDITLAAFLLKCWERKHATPKPPHDKIDSS